MRRETLFIHHTLNIFHHNNRIIYQQTDREHHGEHRQHVDRVAHSSEYTERTKYNHRHSNRRNKCRAEVLKEKIHNQNHQHNRFHQRLNHALNGDTNERSSVKRNNVFVVLREVLRELFHLLVDELGSSQSICAGSKLNCDS